MRHARFDHSKGNDYKYRPVIVIGKAIDGSLVMMVASSTNKLHLTHDYPIRNWQEAGLVKPSIARADRIAKIPAGYLDSSGYIGTLSEDDIEALTRMLAKIANGA